VSQRSAHRIGHAFSVQLSLSLGEKLIIEVD
jgi:hypothetical protein